MRRRTAAATPTARIQNLNFRDDGVFDDTFAADFVINNQTHNYELVI